MHLQAIHLRADQFPTNNRYPFNQAVLRETPVIEFVSPVTFFAGENGTGKTTLLEAICRKCGIHMWRSAERSRYEVNPHEDQLYRYIEAEWVGGPVPGAFFGSDTFRHFTRSLDEWAAADPGMLDYFGGQSLVTKSHGQSMMAYFRSRYRIPGLYLLDEPETALSPKNQLALARLLVETGRAGRAQFIVATHSPILLACPDATILSFDSAPVETIAYQDTETFVLYRRFMENPGSHMTLEDPS